MQPGPGKYSVKTTLDKKGIKFNVAKRKQAFEEIEQHKTSPGPDAYTPTFKINRKGVKISPERARSTVRPRPTPDPARYSPQPKYNKSPSYSFSKIPTWRIRHKFDP